MTAGSISCTGQSGWEFQARAASPFGYTHSEGCAGSQSVSGGRFPWLLAGSPLIHGANSGSPGRGWTLGEALHMSFNGTMLSIP